MGIRNRLFKYFFPEVLANSAIRRMFMPSGIVLTYHEVLPDEVDLPAWTIVRESDFRRQMNYLQRHFNIVAMDQAFEIVLGKINIRKPFAVVTFDDGYKGNLTTALPIMESMGLPFTVYIATAAIIERRLYWYDNIINLLNIPENVQLTLVFDGGVEYFRIIRNAKAQCRWEEIQRLLTILKRMPPTQRELEVKRIKEQYDEIGSALEMLSPEDLKNLSCSNCVTVGSHSHGHELLDQLNSQEISHTLQISNRHIVRITGNAPKHFAYPNGDYNHCVLDLVREAGYETAVTIKSGIWSSRSDLLEIPRLSIGRFDTKYRFRAMLSGYY